MDRIEVKDARRIVAMYRREILRDLRREANRVRRNVRQEAPKRSGKLRRAVKVTAGWDAGGPWARVTTTARRRSRSERTGRTTTFRYGLAIQQHDHYLQRGLQRTPRR